MKNIESKKMTIQLLSQFVDSSSPAVFLTEAHPDLIKEIQKILKIKVDGIVGQLTKQAFSEFKEDNNLEYPLGLGITTAKRLLAIADNEETAVDKEGIKPEVKVNKAAGDRTGATMKLPGGETVYANQFIVEGIPLTWGEATKDCARIPTSAEYVANAIKLAKIWGKVRDKFGSPLAITSGYRPPAVNRAVGGVGNSQHLYFLALDMQPMNGDFHTLWEVLKASQFSGLGDAVFMGKNKGFFHADIRPGGRVIFAY